MPVIRVIQESLAATEMTKVFGIVNGTTNFILTEMARTGASYDEALARAQELGYAEADPTDDVGGADAAAKMAILARLAFDTPVGLDDVSYEGITEIRPDDIAYAKELGLSLKLLGVAERRGRRRERPRLPVLPLPRPSAGAGRGAVQRGHGPGARDHRDHDVRPGAGGVATATAVLGDVVSILAGDAPVHETRRELAVVSDVASSFYLHLEVADRPGRSRRGRRRPRARPGSRSRAWSSAAPASRPAS